MRKTNFPAASPSRHGFALRSLQLQFYCQTAIPRNMDAEPQADEADHAPGAWTRTFLRDMDNRFAAKLATACGAHVKRKGFIAIGKDSVPIRGWRAWGDAMPLPRRQQYETQSGPHCLTET